MKSRDILIEVDGEKIQTPRSSLQCLRVLLNAIVKVLRSLRSKRSDLLIAAGVPWNKEYRNALDL